MPRIASEADRIRYILDQLDVSRIDIHVNADGGSDANSGLTDSLPLETLIEAEKRIPFVVDRPVFLHVRRHPGAGYAPPTFRRRTYMKNIYVVGEDSVELLAGTITSNWNLVQTADVATGADDVLRGKSVEILSGPMAGERRTLRTNTGMTFEPMFSFSATVPEGSTFRIFESDVVIDTAGQNWNISEGGGEPSVGRQSAVGLVFINLKILSDAAFLEMSFLGSLVLYGVEVSGSVVNCWFNGTNGASFLHIGSDVPINAGDEICSRIGLEFGASSPTAWGAWGLSFPTANTFLHLNQLNAYILGLNINRQVIWSSRVRAYGFRLSNGLRMLGGETGASSAYYSAHTPFFGDGNASRIEGTFNPVVASDYPGSVLQIDCAITSLNDGTCIAARFGGSIRMFTSAGSLVLNAGTGIGISAVTGGRIELVSVTTITAGTQLSCGKADPVTGTAASISASGAHIEHSDGSIIYTP